MEKNKRRTGRMSKIVDGNIKLCLRVCIDKWFADWTCLGYDDYFINNLGRDIKIVFFFSNTFIAN